MNIKEQTEHYIYYNNLKLAEIRGDIEDQIKRVDFFAQPSEELLKLRDQLEEIYNKLS